MTTCRDGSIGCLLLIVAMSLAACAGQRPVHEIRLSADQKESLGDHQAAAEEYGRIVERYPGDWRAQAMLGRCCLELDRLGRARRSLEIAASLRPDDDEIAGALAETMLRQGDYDRLFVYLTDRASRRQTSMAYVQLARNAREMGDLDAAKVALDAAIAFDEGTVEPHLEAAAFAQTIGNLDGAVDQLRRAYAIDPTDERVTARLAELGESPGPTMVGAAARR